MNEFTHIYRAVITKENLLEDWFFIENETNFVILEVLKRVDGIGST